MSNGWGMGLINGMHAVLKYFPKELWATLDPKNHRNTTNGTTPAVNGIRKSTSNVISTREEVHEGTNKMVAVDEDEPVTAVGERDPDEAAMEDVVDDAFDEDDDDGGDYNAEQYFDDGGDDAGDDMDGGGGGDYY